MPETSSEKPSFLVAKIVAAACVGLLLVAVGWAVLTEISGGESSGPNDGDSEPAVAVEVRPVDRGAIRNVRTFTGSLDARSAFTVAPNVSGRLERLHVDIGDVVEAGQLIAELDDEEHVQEVEQARAELAVARANLEEVRSSLANAERDLERFSRLREQRIASESELDASQAEYDARRAQMSVAEAQVSQREAALRAAEVRKSYTRIHARWDGGSEQRIVGQRHRDQGDMLSTNAEIISLLDIDTLRAIIYVPERDYPNIAGGQSASIMADAYPGQEFEATVIRVSPRFERGSRQARVELEVPNADHRLKPGMFARVRLEVGYAEDALVVPGQAIVNREGRTGVFVVNDEGTLAQFVDVTTGFMHGGQVQILSPDIQGRVVTLGHHLLAADAEGARVTIASRDDVLQGTDEPSPAADEEVAEGD